MALHASHYNAIRAIGSEHKFIGKEASATLPITGRTEIAKVLGVL